MPLGMFYNNFNSFSDFFNDCHSFAGAETTANSSIFTVILLLQNPDCLEKLRHELDNALGYPSEEMPLADHEVLKGLPYLNACIWEGFRYVD